MYRIEFKGSPRHVGNALQGIAQLAAPVRYWNALAKSLASAKHYPLDDRHASAMVVWQAASDLAEASPPEKKALVTASSDMARFDLPSAENVVISPSKECPGDLSVSAFLHPTRLPFLATDLAEEGLKFVATPAKEEAIAVVNEDIFA